jgi:UDP-N-acetylmuramoylalanine--D-glutamate ligase
MNVASKKVVVLGAGESGRAAAELLSAKGAEVVLRNSTMNARVEELGRVLAKRGVVLQAGPDSAREQEFDFAVISPGVDPKVEMVNRLQKKNIPILAEIELAYRFCPTPIVAITGTNGKSTTTELVEKIFQRAGLKTVACGNIGKPFSDVIREGEKLDVIVLELSSFQLEAIQNFQPQVSVYLNLTPDHLDRYASLAEYKEAKDRIFLNQTASNVAVVNADLDLPEMQARTITLSSQHERAEYVLRDGWLCRRQERILEQATTALRGPHNAENMLAALAVADIYGIDRAVTTGALRDYRALPHRCEKVRELRGVVYINDSKATNIDAMEKALLGLGDEVILIAGGKDKGFDFSTTCPLIRQKVRHAVLMGEMRHKLFQLWQGDTACHQVGSLEEAVKLAQQLGREGFSVLLSPGCSSYDMFKDFEDRGDQFKRLVSQLT